MRNDNRLQVWQSPRNKRGERVQVTRVWGTVDEAGSETIGRFHATYTDDERDAMCGAIAELVHAAPRGAKINVQVRQSYSYRVG